MTEKITSRSKSELLVLLNEEYGYRQWYWFPMMSDESFIHWWQKLKSVKPYYMTPITLPGELIEVNEAGLGLFNKLMKKDEFAYVHLHWDDDSFLLTADKDKVFHAGYYKK